jgi:hypothetical protein
MECNHFILQQETVPTWRPLLLQQRQLLCTVVPIHYIRSSITRCSSIEPENCSDISKKNTTVVSGVEPKIFSQNSQPKNSQVPQLAQQTTTVRLTKLNRYFKYCMKKAARNYERCYKVSLKP